MHLSVVNFSPQIFPSHPYTHRGIHIFESSGEMFHHILKTYWCGQSSFLTPSSLGPLSSLFCISHIQKMQYTCQKFLSVPCHLTLITYHHDLSHLTSPVPCKLFGSLSRLDAINLSINLS